MILQPEQQRRVLEVFAEYRNAPPNAEGQRPSELYRKMDQERIELIQSTLLPLLRSLLGGDTALDQFKSQIDGINKRHQLWGFRGIKGQMFFNMLANVAATPEELDSELKSALVLPSNEELARSRIKTFVSYVKRIGDDYVDAGGSKNSRPKVSSIPFFLSYFWQVQDHQTWPVYYTNSVQVMGDLNLWQPSEDPADDYIAYKHIHEELIQLFDQEIGRAQTLYDVEHVFWFKGGNPFGGSTPAAADTELTTIQGRPLTAAEETPAPSRLPNSYVPPIVAVLPRMALHDPGLIEAAKASGTSLDRAYEKSIHAALTMLGYETKLLGQGGGRVPDGLAVDLDNSYALLWDGKIRSGGYWPTTLEMMG